MSLKDEYFCPHCGAILNDQSGFDPDNGTWTCTECGQELYGNDIYDGDSFPGVMWYCDECGALLNKQSGFRDSCATWFCTKCGYMNTISEENIFESKADKMRASLSGNPDKQNDDEENEENDGEEYEYDGDHEDDEEGEYDEDHEDDEEGEYDGDYEGDEENGNNDENKNNEEDDVNDGPHIRVNNDKTNKKVSAQTWVGIAVFLFFLVAVPWFMLSMLTETPVSSKECIGKNYKIIVRQFQDAGFKNIECIPVEDLNDGLIFKDTNKINTVQSISIKGNTKFKKGKEYYKRDAVTLYYHIYPTE